MAADDAARSAPVPRLRRLEVDAEAVQARHGTAAPGPTEATLPFTIEARLVDQLWFRLLLVLGGLGLSAILVRAHLHRVRERELKVLVDERTAQLRAARNESARQAAQLEVQAAELAQKADELAAADARKSRFFANVSHELRTPLTLIHGPVAGCLSAGQPMGPVDLARVARSSRRLEALIEELLDIARLDAGRLPLAAWPDALHTFLAGRVEGFAVLADARGVALGFDGPPVTAWFDPGRLAKIFDNLLANALRHTPAGGSVRVSLAAGDDSVVVSVRDTGTGIAPEHLPHVFDRFYQAPGGRDGTPGSAGLGLALARALVERHGGVLEVRSTPEEGATFTFSLPLGADHLAAEDRGNASASVPPPPAVSTDLPSAPAPGTTGETVLLAEEDPDLRAWLRQVLSAHFAVLEAADGAEALQLARQHVPDLVLTDAMMPELDGLALCAALRDAPVTSHLPVVMLSARTSADRRVEGLGSGVDADLGKPVHPEELILQVRNLLDARARLRTQHRKHLVLADPTPVQPSADERFLTQVRRTIQEHMADEDFGVAELADALHMSRRQLGRKLSGLTGAPPSALLRELRLQRGRGLLEQGAGTISEVAYAVGFRRPARFSEQFRAAFGQSPSDYRRQVQDSGRSDPPA